MHFKQWKFTTFTFLICTGLDFRDITLGFHKNILIYYEFFLPAGDNCHICFSRCQWYMLFLIPFLDYTTQKSRTFAGSLFKMWLAYRYWWVFVTIRTFHQYTIHSHRHAMVTQIYNKKWLYTNQCLNFFPLILFETNNLNHYTHWH